jgi:formate dehydrogenase maturation protein FdhE
MTDHGQLVTLVPESGDRTRTIEACQGCLGYLKSFTVLQPSAGAVVLLDDLASADLDIAAVEQGYKRAGGLGYPLEVGIVEKHTTKRRLGLWNR